MGTRVVEGGAAGEVLEAADRKRTREVRGDGAVIGGFSLWSEFTGHTRDKLYAQVGGRYGIAVGILVSIAVAWWRASATRVPPGKRRKVGQAHVYVRTMREVSHPSTGTWFLLLINLFACSLSRLWRAYTLLSCPPGIWGSSCFISV